MNGFYAARSRAVKDTDCVATQSNGSIPVLFVGFRSLADEQCVTIRWLCVSLKADLQVWGPYWDLNRAAVPK